jgi:hypothetical protein
MRDDTTSKVLRYIIAQMQQASSWRGIILVITALFGFNVSEEKAAAVTLIGLTAAGLMGMLFPDQLPPPPPPPPKDPP